MAGVRGGPYYALPGTVSLRRGSNISSSVASGVTGVRLSGLSCGVLRLLSRSTEVPFLRITEVYGISKTTVRRHISGLRRTKILRKDECIVGTRVVNCRAYTCVNLCLGSPARFSIVISGLERVPRIIRYRCAAKSFSVFVGICTGGGRRLLGVVRSGLRPLNLSRSRAVISFGTIVGHRPPVTPAGS